MTRIDRIRVAPADPVHGVSGLFEALFVSGYAVRGPANMSWTSFDLGELLSALRASGEPWFEFLRVPSLRAGLYVLAPGAWDHQTPHQEDEVYYVVAGRATFEAGQERREAIPGALIYVAAGQEHRFTEIFEELRVLVFFSAAPR
jgi:mannose-6-phosphate isomerase-like protein (cupin superfamily)